MNAGIFDANLVEWLVETYRELETKRQEKRVSTMETSLASTIATVGTNNMSSTGPVPSSSLFQSKASALSTSISPLYHAGRPYWIRTFLDSLSMSPSQWVQFRAQLYAYRCMRIDKDVPEHIWKMATAQMYMPVRNAFNQTYMHCCIQTGTMAGI